MTHDRAAAPGGPPPTWLLHGRAYVGGNPRPPRDVIGLAALLAASGSLHLVRPRHFEHIVPRRLPAKRCLVYVSGIAEIGCAMGLIARSTRRLAGLLSAGLLVAVFPANVQMAVDVFERRGSLARTLALARLPVQVPLIRIAWRAWTGDRSSEGAQALSTGRRARTRVSSATPCSVARSTVSATSTRRPSVASKVAT